MTMTFNGNISIFIDILIDEKYIATYTSKRLVPPPSYDLCNSTQVCSQSREPIYLNLIGSSLLGFWSFCVLALGQVESLGCLIKNIGISVHYWIKIIQRGFLFMRKISLWDWGAVMWYKHNQRFRIIWTWVLYPILVSRQWRSVIFRAFHGSKTFIDSVTFWLYKNHYTCFGAAIHVSISWEMVCFHLLCI